MTEPLDVITMGRIGVDLYPLQTGEPLARVESFGKFLGGSPTNVAVAASRLGRRTAVITRTGRDPFGDYCHQALRGFGVDDRWVTPVDTCPTPVTFCEIFPPDHFPLYFYRRPVAPDLLLEPDALDLDAIRRAPIFWMSGTGLCAEPSRAATLTALEARTAAAGDAPDPAGPRHTVFDLDWRPMFWEDQPDHPQDGAAHRGADGGPHGRTDPRERARPHYAEALAHATVAVGNTEECEVATGADGPDECAEALLAAGVELAVVKRGPRGVLAVHRDGTRVQLPPLPVEVVNGLGAGDAFGGSLCHGLLADWPVERVLRRANAAGALVASRLACSSAMPTAPEIDRLLSTGSTSSTSSTGSTGSTGSAGPAEPAADHPPGHPPAPAPDHPPDPSRGPGDGHLPGDGTPPPAAQRRAAR